MSWVQGLLHFLFFEVQGIQFNDNLSFFEVEICSGCYVWIYLHSLACSHSAPSLFKVQFFLFSFSFPMCVSDFFIKDQVSLGVFICILAFSLIHWSMCVFCANANLKSEMVLGQAVVPFILSNEKLFSFYITIQLPTFQRGSDTLLWGRTSPTVSRSKKVSLPWEWVPKSQYTLPQP